MKRSFRWNEEQLSFFLFRSVVSSWFDVLKNEIDSSIERHSPSEEKIIWLQIEPNGNLRGEKKIDKRKEKNLLVFLFDEKEKFSASFDNVWPTQLHSFSNDETIDFLGEPTNGQTFRLSTWDERVDFSSLDLRISKSCFIVLFSLRNEPWNRKIDRKPILGFKTIRREKKVLRNCFSSSKFSTPRKKSWSSWAKTCRRATVNKLSPKQILCRQQIELRSTFDDKVLRPTKNSNNKVHTAKDRNSTKTKRFSTSAATLWTSVDRPFSVIRTSSSSVLRQINRSNNFAVFLHSESRSSLTRWRRNLARPDRRVSPRREAWRRRSTSHNRPTIFSPKFEFSLFCFSICRSFRLHAEIRFRLLTFRWPHLCSRPMSLPATFALLFRAPTEIGAKWSRVTFLFEFSFDVFSFFKLAVRRCEPTNNFAAINSFEKRLWRRNNPLSVLFFD